MIRSILFLLLAASAIGLSACGQTEPPAPAPATEVAAAPAPAEARTLAAYPAPAFLENLTLTGEDAVLVTYYTGRRIERVSLSGGAETFAALEDYPVSIIPAGAGYLVAAHAVSFASGEDFIGRGVMLELGPDGAVLNRWPLPGVLFANGILAAPDGRVLIADSVSGAIHQFDPASGEVAPWFADPVLQPAPPPAFRPGTNGLKWRGDDLLVSSSASRTIYRLAVAPDGSATGGLDVLIRDLPGVDDFAVTAEGGLVLATHGRDILHIAADGRSSVLTEDPQVLGNTAVAIAGAGPGRSVVVLGTGGFSEGGSADAAVVLVPFPE